MKAQFKDGYAFGYKMAVGECFREALEKESFNTGDIFYDTPVVYYLKWKDALLYVNCAFHVVSSNDGDITFNVLIPSANRGSLILKETKTMSVSGFIINLQRGLDSSAGKDEAQPEATKPAIGKPKKTTKKAPALRIKIPARSPKAKKAEAVKPVTPTEVATKPKAEPRRRGTTQKDPKQQSLF
jgi:hypothetical protein